jgi:hypothetical protein
MPRRNAISSANATCAAARLTAAGVAAGVLVAGDSVSATAVGRLAAGAADDAERALTAADSTARGPRPRRLLARAERQLRLAYVLSTELRAARDPAAVQAAVLFTAGARLAAACFALLACRPGRGLRRPAVRALARGARMQTEIATTVAAVQRTDAHELGAALRGALGAQQELLAALERAAASAPISARRRRALRAIGGDAERVHDQLATALACAPVA